MTDDLVIDVNDLVGHLGASRSFRGSRRAKLRLGDAVVDDAVEITGQVTGTVEGVLANFEASAPVHLSCVRCLKEWVDEITVVGDRYFATTPDEDGYGIVERTIDVGAPAVDEVALSLPSAPVCQKDCLGLCPTCGTDLNSEPCDGHGEDSDSPFAALKDLFDS